MTVSDRALRIAAAVNGLLIVVAGAIYAANNLGNRYFWTDESSTFLSSLGWPGVGQEPRGLGAIKEQLAYYFDPGAFHFLLRLWVELFGSSIQSLRSLPFLFFLLYLLGLAFWYRQLRVPMAVGFAGVSVMFLDRLSLHYAVELRPYSASLAAAVVLPLLAMYLIRQPTWYRTVSVVLIGALLGSMQYTEVGVIVGTASLLTVGLVRCRISRERVLLGIAAASFLLLLPVAFLVTRGLPTTSLERDLTYVEAMVIRQMDASQILHTLQTNLLSLTALPRTIFLMTVPLVLIALRTRLGPHRFRDRLAHAVAPDIRALWLYVSVATVAAAVLSILGFLPWIVGTRWSITEIALIGLSVAGVITVAFRLMDPRRTALLLGVAVLSVAVSLTGSVRFATFERGGSHEGLAYLGPQLLSAAPGTALVDYWIYPDVRYWMEYSGDYPNLEQMWIEHDVKSTVNYGAADREDIKQFLDGDYEVLLLRSEVALEESGVELPDGVRVLTVPIAMRGNASESDLPILLVKR